MTFGRIGQATGLRASAAVTASAPQDTAEQALPGITITHGTVNKAFDLHAGDFLDPADLRKTQFSGRNQAPCSFKKEAPYSPVMVIWVLP